MKIISGVSGTIALLFVATTAMAGKLEITCTEIEGVLIGQPIFNCTHRWLSSSPLLPPPLTRWVEKPDRPIPGSPLLRPVLRIIEVPNAPTVLPLPIQIADPDMPKLIRTVPLAQMPFDTPAFVPDEETKKRALKRAFELNDNKMCCGFIDLTDDPIVHPELVPKEKGDEPTKPSFKERMLVPPPVEPKREKLKLLHRIATKERDVCTMHGMHKVEERGGKSWRCRK